MFLSDPISKHRSTSQITMECAAKIRLPNPRVGGGTQARRLPALISAAPWTAGPDSPSSSISTPRTGRAPTTWPLSMPPRWTSTLRPGGVENQREKWSHSSVDSCILPLHGKVPGNCCECVRDMHARSCG